MRDYLKENIEIKKEVEDTSKKKTMGCVSVREIAKKIHKDPNGFTILSLSSPRRKDTPWFYK